MRRDEITQVPKMMMPDAAPLPMAMREEEDFVGFKSRR